MKVFLAGGTGVIGRSLVPRLVAAGHQVCAISRSEGGVQQLESQGALGVRCDVFDDTRLRKTMLAASPEVVIHQLTALPDRTDFRKASTFEATNRLRREGTRLLLDAAHASGAMRFICQSIAFVYDHTGGPIKSEGDRLLSAIRGPFSDALAAIAEMEGMVLAEPQGIVLRYGFFYGPGTTYGLGHGTAEDVQKRRFPIVGAGEGMFSFIHVDDAAAATVAAVERGQAGVYNIVDDDPAPMRAWLPVYADAIGAPHPRKVPAWLGALVAGRTAIQLATQMRGASNEKAKRELCWMPRHSSWRRGFAEAVKQERATHVA